MPPYAWTLLWPGLARLWLRGEWSGLGIAAIFAALVNGLIVTTFLWPRTIGTDQAAAVLNVVGWFVVLCFWGASVWTTWRLLPRLQPGADARGDDALFMRAQSEYLRGHWYDAEQLVERLLAESPRDVDAHLLLATLYRHTQRYEEARQRLMLIERLEGGSRWRFEVDEERRRLAELVGRATATEGVSGDETPASKAQAA